MVRLIKKIKGLEELESATKEMEQPFHESLETTSAVANIKRKNIKKGPPSVPIAFRCAMFHVRDKTCIFLEQASLKQREPLSARIFVQVKKKELEE